MLLVAPPSVGAAGARVALKRFSAEYPGTFCSAYTEERELGGPLFVQAKVYAACIGASYEWSLANRMFYLQKGVGNRTVGVSFWLDTGKAYVWSGDSFLHEFNLKALSLNAYELGGDGPNMAPFRFLNDAFDIRTEWSEENRAAVFNEDLHALPPSWDFSRSSIRDYGGRLDSRSLKVTPPAGGWTILPSTLFTLEQKRSLLQQLKATAEDKGQRWEVDRSLLKFVLYQHGAPEAPVIFEQNLADNTTTVYFAGYTTARNYLTKVNKDLNQVEYNQEVTGETYNLVDGILSVVGADKLSPILNIAKAVDNIRFAKLKLVAKNYREDIQACFDIAAQYADDNGTAMHMGLQFGEHVGESGYQCLVF